MVRTNRRAALYLGSYSNVIQLLNYTDDQQPITFEVYNGISWFWNPLTSDFLGQQGDFTCSLLLLYHPAGDSFLQEGKDGLLQL